MELVYSSYLIYDIFLLGDATINLSCNALSFRAQEKADLSSLRFLKNLFSRTQNIFMRHRTWCDTGIRVPNAITIASRKPLSCLDLRYSAGVRNKYQK